MSLYMAVLIQHFFPLNKIFQCVFCKQHLSHVSKYIFFLNANIFNCTYNFLLMILFLIKPQTRYIFHILLTRFEQKQSSQFSVSLFCVLFRPLGPDQKQPQYLFQFDLENLKVLSGLCTKSSTYIIKLEVFDLRKPAMSHYLYLVC